MMVACRRRSWKAFSMPYVQVLMMDWLKSVNCRQTHSLCAAPLQVMSPAASRQDMAGQVLSL